MSIQVEIDPHNRLVRAWLIDDFDFDLIISAINDSVNHPGFERGFNVISDHRGLRNYIAARDMKFMSQHLAKLSHVMAGAKWAVVTGSPISMGQIEILKLYLKSVPIELSLFEDMREAENWVVCS